MLIYNKIFMGDKDVGKDGKALKNLVLISQISICVMVPTFFLLAIGIWIDGRFGTWFTVPLLFLGLAAGGRNAYVLAMNTIRMDEAARKKRLQEEIDEKVARYNQEHNQDAKKD